MTRYTNNLDLRTVEKSDIDEVARMWAFEKGSILTEEAQKAIEWMHSNHQKNTTGNLYHLCFAIFETGKNQIIGWCGLDGRVEGQLHVFYMIDKTYRNRGYATQCASKLLAYAFDEAHVPFVNGGCDKANHASQRVMVKIGMKQLGVEANGDPLFYIDDETYKQIQHGGMYA